MPATQGKTISENAHNLIAWKLRGDFRNCSFQTFSTSEYISIRGRLKDVPQRVNLHPWVYKKTDWHLRKEVQYSWVGQRPGVSFNGHGIKQLSRSHNGIGPTASPQRGRCRPNVGCHVAVMVKLLYQVRSHQLPIWDNSTYVVKKVNWSLEKCAQL